MPATIPYDRERAVKYATEWAYRRNPRYLDFHDIGGDCTSFVSQCLYDANLVMNFTPIYGWYYISADNRTASWSGVQYFYNFLVSNQGTGPFASEAGIESVRIGDVIQLGDENRRFYHTLIITDVGDIPDSSNILVAAHTNDCLCRPLNTYEFAYARFLHIDGVRYDNQNRQ